MSDELLKIINPEKTARENVLWVRLDEDLYKQIYAISKRNSRSMSRVARECLEFALPQVEQAYEELAKLQKKKWQKKRP